MISQKNNFLWFKINGLFRLILIHGFSGFFPLYIVNEYPKSGGTWLAQMISEALEVPFPRNRLPMLRSSVMHGHYLWPGKMKNAVILWRDGRDIIISQYYHSLFRNEKGNARLVETTRKNVAFSDYENITGNLCAFIKYVYEGNGNLRFSWADFYRIWGNRSDVLHTKYENLRKDPVNELQRIVLELSGRKVDLDRLSEIAENYSFEKQAGRKPGQEDTKSFMRKGVVGDWINHFPPEALRLFDKYAGEALIGLGYEKDHSWAGR